MRFSVVTSHVYEREGVAPSRVSAPTCQALMDLGHEVEVWSWNDREPEEPVPSWYRWLPLPPRADDGWLTRRWTGLRRPRREVLRANFSAAADSIAVADETLSFPAVADAASSVLFIHHLELIDLAAVRGRPTVAMIQKHRAQQFALRNAQLVLCTSPRVTALIRRPDVVSVPVTHEIAGPLTPVAEPVAGVLANWLWPPNAWALGRLLRAWPRVRDGVPGARLLLAGHGLDRVGSIAGVEVLGHVAHSEDVLGQLATLAFPCPPSTGAKIKVLEAIGRGIPVVTTTAGAEGLRLSPDSGVALTRVKDFAESLTTLLRDPERRALLGAQGRRDIVEHHSPARAATAWVDACQGLIDGQWSD